MAASSSSEIQALQRQIQIQIQGNQQTARRERDSQFMEPAAPLLKVGRLANEFEAAGSVRGGEPAGGANPSYTEKLLATRDSESANKMPRSQGSWEKEQARPGSWQSGVGAMKPVGQGSSTTLGVARPLFTQQKDKE